jgi:putative transposase
MKNLEYREYYRRNLPHLQPRGATFLMNFRLSGSLPAEVIGILQAETKQIKQRLFEAKSLDERYKLRKPLQHQHFNNWDAALHATRPGTFFLREDTIAGVVTNSIRFHDREWFDVDAFCIMPNHVHLIITPYERSEDTDYSLTQIMHNIKRNSAKQANKILNRTGAFWQHENYDHYIRDSAELERIIEYVLSNPVKAGLVDDWTQWKWSYCKYDL